MAVEIFKLITGLVAVTWGADIFVRAATRIAQFLGVSSLVIGLTVVAFGTSAPELFVSAGAALRGTADIAVGNVIGSNIFNILMIIGISAVLTPVMISSGIVSRELPVMIAVMVVFVLFAFNGIVSRLEGALLFAGIIGYVIYNYSSFKAERKKKDLIVSETLLEEARSYKAKEGKEGSITIQSLFLVAGLVLLAFGSDWTVEAARLIARSFGVSDAVIGVTLVAVGTSLPELATTVAAAVRGHPELAIGNAIGSNVFNVFCVLGATSLILPLSVNPSLLQFDLWFMLGACVATFLVMLLRNPLDRVGGAALVVLYFVYIAYLLSQHGA